MSFVDSKCNVYRLYLTEEGKKRYAGGKFIVDYFDVIDLEAGVEIPSNIIDESNKYLNGYYGVEHLYKSEYIIDDFFSKIPVFECCTTEYINEHTYENSVCGLFFDNDLKYTVKVAGSEDINKLIEVNSGDTVVLNVELDTKYDNPILECFVEVEEITNVDVNNDISDITNCKYFKTNVMGDDYTTYYDSFNNSVLMYRHRYHVPNINISVIKKSIEKAGSLIKGIYDPYSLEEAVEKASSMLDDIYIMDYLNK